MKIQSVATVAALLLYSNISFGQEETKQQISQIVLPASAVESACFVLQAGNKSSEPLTSDEARIGSLDANTIESISVVKGQGAIDRYGKKGTNGIVIITFRDFNVLPLHIQRKMTHVR